MADNVRQALESYEPIRARREELIRPVDRRRDFTTREAQRRLQEKERPHWALVAYAVFLLAVLLIFCVAYTTYAFSKYRGEILPGVHVDRLRLAGLTRGQAEKLLNNAAQQIYDNPVRLVYGSAIKWKPSAVGIGYHPDINGTVQEAVQVGRHENFFTQLLDRTPIHPDHSVPLLYTLGDAKHPPDTELRAYLEQKINTDRQINQPPTNASLKVDQKTAHILLLPSSPGHVIDIPRTIETIHAALGSLTTQTKAIPVNFVKPVITTEAARQIQDRVERFLSYPPVIAVGKQVIVTSRWTFAPAFQFKPNTARGHAEIDMIVNSSVVSAYVAKLASSIDRPAQNAQLDFSAGQVRVLSPRKTGRTLDQADAMAKLVAVIKGLTPHARLHFKVTVTQPPIDVANPASLGIDRLLNYGWTSFRGAPESRLSAITDIASSLNKILIQPNQDIDFNQLVGTNWSPSVFVDEERDVGGRLVPGKGGAMQQVATTFLRALYNSGLQLEERHAHVHRFAWYEPPVGLDAVVDPGKNEDLRFRNNTGHYLFVKTRVEPVRQEVYVYVYGPKLGWKVSVDTRGTITKTYPHGADLYKQDPSMAPGDIRQIAFAHDGADTVVERTIEYTNGNVKVDRITTHYQPWRSIFLTGRLGKPTLTPTSTPTSKWGNAKQAKPTATATPGATPTPTFSH